MYYLYVMYHALVFADVGLRPELTVRIGTRNAFKWTRVALSTNQKLRNHVAEACLGG
jgi:hypothetical protein